MDLKLTFTIAEEKVDEYVDDYVYVYKNTETNEDGTPKYNDKQWAREHILRHIKGQIIKGKNAKNRDSLEAQNADSVS